MKLDYPAPLRRRYRLFQLAFWGGYWVLNLVYAQAFSYSSPLMPGLFLCLSLLLFGLTQGLHRLYLNGFHARPVSVLCLHLLWALPLSALLSQLLLGMLGYQIISRLPEDLLPQPAPGQIRSSVGALIGYTINTTLILVLWCLVYLLYMEWHKRREAEREHWRNQLRLREVELQFLRSQINSHFLFNALNNIRSLILENPEAARGALNDLATLLRGLMHNETRDTVSLAEELALVDGYLALEALQFEQRLRYEKAIEPALLDARLPPLLLQTLVENAVKHGIARRRDGGLIRIGASTDAPDRWRLSVESPEAELPASHAGEGIGLNNARQRLSAAFGEAARLELRPGSTVVAVAELPL